VVSIGLLRLKKTNHYPHLFDRSSLLLFIIASTLLECILTSNSLSEIDHVMRLRFNLAKEMRRKVASLELTRV
jgi:uncharacterized membrane protein YidH (DUF202 family)